MIDLHCHILPGLDDGPTRIDETVSMCRMAARDGVTDIMATPHFLDGRHDVDACRRDMSIDTINAALRNAGLHLKIHPGAEVRLQPDLAMLVRTRPELRLAGSRYVLVELPPVFPAGLHRELFHLRLAGITPILAHVERYDAVQRDPDCLRPMIASGALTQITAQSLTGDFDTQCATCAEMLIHQGMAHILASDAHNSGRRTPVMSVAKTAITELAGPSAFELMTEKRPWAILHDEPLAPPEPLTARRGKRPGLLARLGALL